MKTRYFLAMALTLVVMIVWSNFVVKPNSVPVPSPQVQRSAVQNTNIVNNTVEQPIVPEVAYATVLVPHTKSDATFINACASIKEVTFKEYNAYKFILNKGLFIKNDCNFTQELISDNEIRFVQSDNNKKFIKRFLFSENPYEATLELEIQNLSNAAMDIQYDLLLGTIANSGNNKAQQMFQGVIIANKEKVSYPNFRKDASFTGIQFIGLRDRYFCAILQPLSGVFDGKIRKISNQESEVGLMPVETRLLPGQQLVHKFHIYIGPQDIDIIQGINPEWTNVVNYGTFDFIAKLALQLLRVLFNVFHNWGMAIVILSVLIFVILFPLTFQQIKSMKEMQALQPHLEKLKKLYKDNPQRLNKETIELYREHKVNPFGGCLPPLLQMPILFALYQALNRSIALKGAHFLWIKDLSEPDSLFVLSTHLPLIDNKINIIPILTAVSMFIQQKMTMVSTGSGNEEQQKMMMIIMPIMFGVFFYNFPAGVVIYWFVNGLLMLLFQVKMMKKHG